MQPCPHRVASTLVAALPDRVAPASDACAGLVPGPDIVFLCCAAKQLKQQLETLLAPKK